MGLEAATYIDDLNSANPDGADGKSQGDDHIRLIKAVLLATFPNITGAVAADQGSLVKHKLDGGAAPTVNDDSGEGYSVASIWIDLTNNLAYICVDSTLGAAVWVSVSGIKTGMHMMFFQSSTTVMTGWTFQTKDEDYIVRPGATNTDGGTTSGTANNSGWAITGITGTQPNHTHGAGTLITGNPTSGNVGADAGVNVVALYAHNHDIIGSTASDGNDAVTITSAGTWRPPTMFGTVWSKN